MGTPSPNSAFLGRAELELRVPRGATCRRSSRGCHDVHISCLPCHCRCRRVHGDSYARGPAARASANRRQAMSGVRDRATLLRELLWAMWEAIVGERLMRTWPRPRLIAREVFLIVSIVVLFASSALWIRSYWHADQLQYASGGPAQSFYELSSSRAGIGVLVHRQSSRPIPSSFTITTSSARPIYYSAAGILPAPFMGIGIIVSNVSLNGGGATVQHWLIVLLFGALPLKWCVRRWRTRKRVRRLGTCRHCGYDLRGTPDHCPECGLAAPADEWWVSTLRD